jgi:sugar/nucleoside kinase (ribokinase family)
LSDLSTPRVVVLGDLIYDLLARIEGPVTFGTDTFAPIHAVAGGSGANAAAWLASLDVETHFVGRVGDDALGEALAADLKKAGVTPHLARDPSLGTGKVFVFVDGAGERTMITDRGAGEALRPEDLPRDLFDEGHLHLSGYTFSGGSRRETAHEALRLAREAGMSVSVDPSSVPLLEEIGPERFLRWTRGANLCFPNLEEGTLLGGVRDPDHAARKLLNHYAAAVLKLGAGGALYSGAERVRLRAEPARVEDTTGAGDALCAGFLAAWLSGVPADVALRCGVEVAARAVERLGARPGD